MCCCTFKDETRKHFALAIAILSAIVMIGGIVMVALSVVFYTKEGDIWTADLGDASQDAETTKNAIFGVLLTFSFVAVIIGAAGMTCGCGPCKPDATCNWIYPVIYGLVLSFVWIVYFIIGGIVTGIATGLPEAMQ